LEYINKIVLVFSPGCLKVWLRTGKFHLVISPWVVVLKIQFAGKASQG
jgi:hypothetical protein